MGETNRLIEEKMIEKDNQKQWQSRVSGCCDGCSSWVRTNLLMVFTVFGIAAGIALGFGLHPYHLSKDAILIIGFPGDVFMRLLKLMILPLIVTSLITGQSSYKKGQSKVNTGVKF